MQNRIILHIDMDAFFPAVEERESPQFRGMPIIVGADPKKGRGRGVVSSASYSARKFGIKSGMPISKAWRHCPEAIFLPVNMEFYQKVSEKIFEIVKKYSPIFEQVSLDEAYLDITFLSQRSMFSTIVENVNQRDCWEKWGKAENLAKKLKKEIFEKEKLTSTIGIGPNKLIAKMATNKAKPNGLLVIKPGRVKDFLELLEIEELPGVGPKTAEKLAQLAASRRAGPMRIKDLKKIPQKELIKNFGKVGESIYQKGRGIDETPVEIEEIIKSIGKEHTFQNDTRDPESLFETFEKIIREVYGETKENNFVFRTVTVVCRFTGFETHTKSKTQKEPIKSLDQLEKIAKNLLLKFLLENPKLIRLIGVRVS